MGQTGRERTHYAGDGCQPPHEEPFTEHGVESEREAVNHPAHYNQVPGVECIDVIEALGLTFCVGNVMKYIWRCPDKGNELEDLKKGRWYLDREIKRLEAGK
jgi:hypothetical protein